MALKELTGTGRSASRAECPRTFLGRLLLVAVVVAVLPTPAATLSRELASGGITGTASQPWDGIFRVVLDPGHGSGAEQPTTSTGDGWDSLHAKFFRPLNAGGSVSPARNEKLLEHELVLRLSMLVKERLDLTATEPGWRQFERMLRRLGARGEVPRVRIDSVLTRGGTVPSTSPVSLEPSSLPPFDPSTSSGLRAQGSGLRAQGSVPGGNGAASPPDPNRDFRLFDSPSRYPPREGDPLHPGRISRIVEAAPHLVVDVHINGSDSRSVRGMSALFVPSHRDFEAVRRHIVEGESLGARTKRLLRYWLRRGRAKTNEAGLVEATWKYFVGFEPVPGGKKADRSKSDGESWNHLTWAYRMASPETPPTTLAGPFEGAFWDRERSHGELRRRTGGLEGLGGDNLYAGQELVRFVRQALWKDRISSGRSLPAPVFGKGRISPEGYLGGHDRPICSSWSVPLYVNSVVAYLELGFLTNARDRWLHQEKAEVMADALAAGIYSLAAGLDVARLQGITAPRGRPIRWKAYGSHVRDGLWGGASPPRIERLGQWSERSIAPTDESRRRSNPSRRQRPRGRP